MWLNPDLGGNSFDDENVHPVHSLYFCWGWQLFLISDDIEEGCAGLMAAVERKGIGAGSKPALL